MNLTDAQKILGLKPDEDLRPQIPKCRDAREHIAELVRIAKDDALVERYQARLIEFDQALAAIQEHLEASGLAAPPLPIFRSAPGVIRSPAPDDDLETFPPAPRRKGHSLASVALILAGIGAAGWFHYQTEHDRKKQLKTQIDRLHREGSALVENRRWPEALNVFQEIEKLDPDAASVQLGRRSIEAGIAEEQTQFAGYWIGQAIAEMEAGKLPEAAASIQQVLQKSPMDPEANSTLKQIESAKITQARNEVFAKAQAFMSERRWDLAIETAGTILAKNPDDAEAQSLVKKAKTALEKEAANRTQAAQLLTAAAARDQGQFDQQSLDLLHEASSLDPENPGISTLLEKFSAYIRTLRVPGDFSTPAEALAAARDRDRVIISAQTWPGPLVITTSVDLQGTDAASTIVECSPDEGSALVIAPGVKGARISGITFRHRSFAFGADRYSAALVRSSSADFMDCRFNDASGHGLAVIEKAQVTADRCRFNDNGWDGAAAIGEGSRLEIRRSEARNNFEHGIETWDGAAAVLSNNLCEGNVRNGIHADTRSAAAVITGNQLIANREFGLVLESASSGSLSGNLARGNLLGGFVVRLGAASVSFADDEANSNLGPGMVLEKGLLPTNYASVRLLKNTEPQILQNADLSGEEAADQAPPAAIIVEPAPQ